MCEGGCSAWRGAEPCIMPIPPGPLGPEGWLVGPGGGPDEAPLIRLMAPAMPTPPGVCVVVPVGVVTVMRLLSLGSKLHSMR